MSDDSFPDLDSATLARLARYVTGAASADEALEVDRWISADPRRRELIQQLTDVWALAGARQDALRPEEFDLERARLVMRRKIRWGERPSRAWPGGPRRRPAWLRPAAAAAIVVLGAGGWWVSRNSPPHDRQTWVAEHRTSLGELRTVVLDDGSRVTLAPGTELRQAPFGKTRGVQLNGKAYFDVTHDPAHPFIVRAGTVETQVLGTSFGVTARPGEAIRVVLRSGRVAVTATSTNKVTRALLEPGQGAVGTADGSLELAPADLKRELAWTTGQLVFAGAPLDSVAQEIGQWFGRPVALDSALVSRRVTGSFPMDSGNAVIHALAALVDARIAHRADTVVFQRRARP